MVQFRAILVALALIAIIVVPRVRRARQARIATPTPPTGEEWHDIPLVVVATSPSTTGGQILTLQTRGLTPITFVVELGANWSSGTLGNTGITTYTGVVRFLSPPDVALGFGPVLERVYKTGVAQVTQRTAVQFEAISLGGEPAALEKGPVRLKLFFSPEVEATYAEAYLNVDLTKHQAELAEKDPEYRQNLVQAFNN